VEELLECALGEQAEARLEVINIIVEGGNVAFNVGDASREEFGRKGGGADGMAEEAKPGGELDGDRSGRLVSRVGGGGEPCDRAR
jgi:hypothetical protein